MRTLALDLELIASGVPSDIRLPHPQQVEGSIVDHGIIRIMWSDWFLEGRPSPYSVEVNIEKCYRREAESRDQLENDEQRKARCAEGDSSISTCHI